MSSLVSFFDRVGNNCASLWEGALAPVMQESNPRTLAAYFCLPFVGPIFQILKEMDLSEKMDNAQNLQGKIQLLELKNEVTRSGLAAIAVKALAIVAMLALAGATGAIFPCLALLGLTAGLYTLRLCHNEDLANSWKVNLNLYGHPM